MVYLRRRSAESQRKTSGSSSLETSTRRAPRVIGQATDGELKRPAHTATAARLATRSARSCIGSMIRAGSRRIPPGMDDIVAAFTAVDVRTGTIVEAAQLACAR